MALPAPGDDPFPLLHLADLDFDLSSTVLAQPAFPAYRLALAHWSTNWDESLEAVLKRTWRRRREKVRALISAREPMGIHAPAELRAADSFPRFELIDLGFDLSHGEESLDALTSAQLAAVQFHPAATKDLTLAAEDIFFTRRERDFAAGLSLPPLPAASSSGPSTDPPAAAAAVAPAAPAPTSGPPPIAAAPPAATPSRLPASARAPAPPCPPPPIASSSNGSPTLGSAPDSPLPFALPAPAAPAPTATAAAATPVRSSRLPSLASRPPPPPPPGLAPAPAPAPAAADERDSEDRASRSRRSSRDRGERELTPGTRQREKERDEYKRSKREREAGSSEMRREESRSSYRERDRERDRERERDRDRDRDRDRERERSRRRSRSRDRSPARSTTSRRSLRDRSRSPGGAASSRKRAASPAQSDVSLRSSVRRRVDEPAPRTTPPPQMPPPDASLPLEIQQSLCTVFLRHFPGRLGASDIAAFLRSLSPRLEPVAIKCMSKRNADHADGTSPHPDVTLAFAMFEERQQMFECIKLADGKMVSGRAILASQGQEQTRSSWRWSDCTPAFVEKCYQRELAHFAAGRHARPGPGATAAAATSLAQRLAPAESSTAAPSPEALPQELAQGLASLYVTNISPHAELGECRDFFDGCDGLIGLALGPIEHVRDLRFRSVWLAFGTTRERERAKQSLYGSRFNGASVKLWIEIAEARTMRTGESHEWLWSEMSKDFRNKHSAAYQRARSDSLTKQPQVPPTNPPHFPPASAAPGGSYYVQQGPSAGSTSRLPASLALPQPPQPQVPPHMQQSLEGYSPLQPGLNLALGTPSGINVPRPPPQASGFGGPVGAPAAYGGAFANNPQMPAAHAVPPNGPASFAPPLQSQPQQPVAKGGASHINPARLAMLAASGADDAIMDATPSANEGVGGNAGAERLDAAAEKKLVEETQRNAWGARRAQSSAPPPSAAVEENGAGAPEPAPQQDSALRDAGAASPAPNGNGPPRTLSLGIKGLAAALSPPRPSGSPLAPEGSPRPGLLSRLSANGNSDPATAPAPPGGDAAPAATGDMMSPVAGVSMSELDALRLKLQQQVQGEGAAP